MSSTQIEWRTDLENAPVDTDLFVTFGEYRKDGHVERYPRFDVSLEPGADPHDTWKWIYYDGQYKSSAGESGADVVIAWAYPVVAYDGDVNA